MNLLREIIDEILVILKAHSVECRIGRIGTSTARLYLTNHGCTIGLFSGAVAVSVFDMRQFPEDPAKILWYDLADPLIFEKIASELKHTNRTYLKLSASNENDIK